MPWSGKFKNGESFTDLTDDELNRFESEIDPSSVSENVDSTKLPSLPEVPSDTPVDYSFVGFANPTTLPKAQKAAEQVMAEQEPGYFSSALDYVRGDEQVDPNLLGKVWKGASQSALYEHPFETGAGIAAGLLNPMAGPMGKMAMSGVAVGAGNVLDQALLDSDTTRTWKERTTETVGSTVGAGLLSGLGYGIASGMKNYAAPYLKAVSDYRAKSKAVQAFRDWIGDAPIKDAAAEVRATKKLYPGESDIDQMIIDQAEDKLQELVDLKMHGADILTMMRQSPEAAKSVVTLVSKKLSNELPEYSGLFGPKNASPTTGEVGRYILENTEVPQAVRSSDYILPDWLARYAQRKMPSLGIIGEATPLGGMARGIGNYVGPRFLPAVDYLAPLASKGLSSVLGVTGGIVGSEATRHVQDKLKNYQLPPVY